MPPKKTYKKKKIDKIDCKMIELLQKDGRTSNTEIAKKIGEFHKYAQKRLQNSLTGSISTYLCWHAGKNFVIMV